MENACEEGNDEDSCNDIPAECYRSATGQCHDWRIGHGLTDVDAAVALARTLQLMRDQDGDGFVDHPEYTVWDAWEIYENMMVEASIPVNTDRVSHSWKGDWNHFNNGQTGAVYYTEDSHYVWIPNGTTQLEARFAPTEFDLDTAQGGALQLEIDLGEDGSNDAQGACTRVSDTWICDLDVEQSHWNTWAHFDITGQAFTFLGILNDAEFFESRIPYTVDVTLTLDLSQPVDISIEQRPDFYSDLDPAAPSNDYNSESDGMLTFTRPVYDQQAIVALIQPKVVVTDDVDEGFFSELGELFSNYFGAASFFFLFILLAALGTGYVLRASRIDEPKLLVSTSMDAELLED